MFPSTVSRFQITYKYENYVPNEPPEASCNINMSKTTHTIYILLVSVSSENVVWFISHFYSYRSILKFMYRIIRKSSRSNECQKYQNMYNVPRRHKYSFCPRVAVPHILTIFHFPIDHNVKLQYFFRLFLKQSKHRQKHFFAAVTQDISKNIVWQEP